MEYSIKNPELFKFGSRFESHSFGGNQEWYSKNWHRRAGCGPTSAANITSYLAHVDEDKSTLYSYNTLDKSNFTKHMDELFRYVTPGSMGVNHINMFIDGVKAFANSKSIPITIESLSVDKKTRKSRLISDLIEFTKKGLLNNSPIAFLVLSRGKEYRLQNWHWITITSVEINGDQVIATASDEGNIRRFDLSLWYLTTKMHGGLIYIA